MDPHDHSTIYPPYFDHARSEFEACECPGALIQVDNSGRSSRSACSRVPSCEPNCSIAQAREKALAGTESDLPTSFSACTAFAGRAGMALVAPTDHQGTVEQLLAVVHVAVAQNHSEQGMHARAG